MKTNTQPSRKQSRAERYRRWMQKRDRDEAFYRLDQRARLVEQEAKR